MAYVPSHKGHWKERDGPSRLPASVAWRVREGLNSSSPKTTAHKNGRNRHWNGRDGPPETVAHLIGRKPHWKERDGPSLVPASVARWSREGLNSRSPESIAHQIGRNPHWKEGDGPSRFPASVAWRVREGLSSSLPKTTAHKIGRNPHWYGRDGPTEAVAHLIGRKRHWKERDGPSLIPASVAWWSREGLSSRSPETIAHQIGRKQHWKERDGPSCVPSSVAWWPREGPNSKLPENIANQIGRNQHWKQRDGPYHIPYHDPASVAWQIREGFHSRSPVIVNHQTGRNRHWKEKDGPSRVPASVAWRFRKGLNSRSPKPIAHQSGRIEYAAKATSVWLAVGLDDEADNLPCSVFLRPVSVEAIESRPGEKLLALAKSCIVNEDDEMGQEHRMKPWVHIAETVIEDLVCSYKALTNEIKDQHMDGIKPTLIARFGKILFRRSPSFPVETCGEVTEASLKRLKKSFYSNLPSSYMENVSNKVITEIGLSFEDRKDIYHVKLRDMSRPGVTICCKCNVIKAEQQLEVYKVELGQMRHMVVDVSCLNKDLDIRLMLRAKRLFTAISEDEKNSITDLIASAILDASVKGGLTWPRKGFSGDRYRVIGAWHTISRTYNNSSMRLKVKHADRFDFSSSHGEVAEEITLKLNGITSELHASPSVPCYAKFRFFCLHCACQCELVPCAPAIGRTVCSSQELTMKASLISGVIADL